MNQNKKMLRIGYLSTMYHTSLLIKGMKWLEGEGLSPIWTLFGTGPAIVDAFAKGKLDLGYIGLAPTIIGIGKGARIKGIAGGHVEGTVIVGKQSYEPLDHFSGDMGKALQQFQGKKLGVPRRGSLHDVFLRYYLSEFGLSQNVEVVNYDWADFIPDAMLKGEMDGAAGTPPLAVLSSKLLGARIIIPPDKIWPYNPSYGIVTTKEMLEKSPDLLREFLEVHKRACSVIRGNPREAAATVSKTVELVDENFVLETYKVSPKYCAALPNEYVQSTLKLVSVLKDLGYLSKELSKEDIFDFDIIEKVHPEAAHYSLQLQFAQ